MSNIDRRMFLAGSLVALSSCRTTAAAPSRVLNEQEAARAIGMRQSLTTSLVLVSSVAAPTGRLGYNSTPATTYRQAYCRAGNHCDDGEFANDCTHFACHGLKSGGVTIQAPSASCVSGLGIRVNDLAESFHNSISRHTNVKLIGSHAQTRRGDFCFIPTWFGLSKEHVMVLTSTATATGAAVWAHTRNRCAETVPFEGQDCIYYRIE